MATPPIPQNIRETHKTHETPDRPGWPRPQIVHAPPGSLQVTISQRLAMAHENLAIAKDDATAVITHGSPGSPPAREIRFDGDQPHERVHTSVPHDWTGPLSVKNEQLLAAILARAPEQWRNVALHGGAPDGWRLSYVIPDPLRAAENSTCRVAIFAGSTADRDGRQPLLRLTIVTRTHAGMEVAETSISLPAAPRSFACPALGIALPVHRLLPLDTNAQIVHALCTSDQRNARIVESPEGAGRELSFTTANPLCHLDMYVSLRVQRLAGREGVTAVAVQSLPPHLRQWLGSDEIGAPGLPAEVARALCQALFTPASCAAESGVSRRRGDRFVRFSIDVPAPGRPQDAAPKVGQRTDPPQRWTLRADFFQSGASWHLGVLQVTPPDGLLRVAYPPSRPQEGFVNIRAPRSEAQGSPPSSAADSATSDGSVRRPASTALETRPARRPRTEGPELSQTMALLQSHSLRGGRSAQVPQTRPATAQDLQGMPLDTLVTQALYRAMLGPAYEHAAVCGPISAGVVLGRGIAFSVICRIAADPTQGMTVPEMCSLLGHEGAHAQTIPYVGTAGMTADQVARDLQDRMDRGEFDRAVICYRADVVRDHHVAVWQHGGQWLLHDGIGEPPTHVLPNGDEAAWLARHCFAALPASLAHGREMTLLAFHSRDGAVGPRAQENDAGPPQGLPGPSPASAVSADATSRAPSLADESLAPDDGPPPERSSVGAQGGPLSVFAVHSGLAEPARQQAFAQLITGQYLRSSRMRAFYEQAGMLARCQDSMNDIREVHIPRALAQALYSERQGGTRVENFLQLPVRRYDDVPFAGGQFSVYVVFANEQLDSAIEICPIPKDQDSQVLDLLLERAPGRMPQRAARALVFPAPSPRGS